MTNFDLPHNGWRPRPHQRSLWGFLDKGGLRASEIWHRRSGKDDVALHWAAVAAHTRIATYWHMLPEFSQGRKAIWTAVNPTTGKRRIDEAFPHELRANTNDSEMFIRFKNGSTWQVVGSDRFDAAVGSPPAGITFSEWALSNPAAWAYLAPILVENKGWAIFITTSRGRNHAKTMHDMAGRTAGWHAQILTVDDTGFPKHLVEAQRKEYHAIFGEEAGDALIEQEYYCSFDAAILGAYWGKELAKAEQDGRIRDIEVDRNHPVHAAWDIGVDDPMAFWLFQVGNGFVNVVDYYESSGHGFDHYCDWMAERGYKGIDWVPHDAKVRELGAPGARTRIETLKLLGAKIGRRPMLVPDHKLMDGINAGRKTIPLARFDAKRCAKGLECLREYKAEWDADARVFKKSPAHDWACVTEDTLVLTRHGMYQIKNLPETGEVLTPCGWKPYHSPRMTRRNAQLVEVKFADGLTVKCTADHFFLTETGWKYARHLQNGSAIQSCLMPSSSILMANFIGHFLRKTISRLGASIFTSLFGRRSSAQFLTAAISTIKTKTLAIIGSKIWNVCRSANISLLLGVNEQLGGINQFPQIKLSLLQPSGTNLRLGAFGTGGRQLGLNSGQSGSEKTCRASTVAKYFRALCVRMGFRRSSVPITAKPLLIESVTPLSEIADVWCLTVDDGHWWSLANGAVTHNSHGADAWRYLSMSWREPVPTEVVQPIRGTSEMTMDEAWKLAHKPRELNARI